MLSGHIRDMPPLDCLETFLFIDDNGCVITDDDRILNQWLLDISLQETWGVSDCERVFDALCHPNEYIWTQAVALVSQWQKLQILTLLPRLGVLPIPTKMYLMPYLSQLSYYEPFEAMIQELKIQPDGLYVDVLIHCLVDTDYYVWPLILLYLSDDSPVLKSRLKKVLAKMGFNALRTPLKMLPEIPHEGVLRDVFGDECINSLYD